MFLAVIGFYFTARHLEKVKIGGGPTPQQVQAVPDIQKEIRGLAPPESRMTDAAFEAAMADPAPLPNAAIEEWNRRRQEGWRPAA